MVVVSPVGFGEPVEADVADVGAAVGCQEVVWIQRPQVAGAVPDDLRTNVAYKQVPGRKRPPRAWLADVAGHVLVHLLVVAGPLRMSRMAARKGIKFAGDLGRFDGRHCGADPYSEKVVPPSHVAVRKATEPVQAKLGQRAEILMRDLGEGLSASRAAAETAYLPWPWWRKLLVYGTVFVVEFLVGVSVLNLIFDLDPWQSQLFAVGLVVTWALFAWVAAKALPEQALRRTKRRLLWALSVVFVSWLVVVGIALSSAKVDTGASVRGGTGPDEAGATAEEPSMLLQLWSAVVELSEPLAYAVTNGFMVLLMTTLRVVDRVRASVRYLTVDAAARGLAQRHSHLCVAAAQQLCRLLRLSDEVSEIGRLFLYAYESDFRKTLPPEMGEVVELPSHTPQTPDWRRQVTEMVKSLEREAEEVVSTEFPKEPSRL